MKRIFHICVIDVKKISNVSYFKSREVYLRKVYDLKKISKLSYVAFKIGWMFFVSEKMEKSLLQNQKYYCEA